MEKVFPELVYAIIVGTVVLVSLAQLIETMHNICKVGVQTPTNKKKIIVGKVLIILIFN